MQLTIHRILLWPKKSGLPPRSIPFVLGKVNVITGQSQSGKSSLISIADYALCSDKCAIPVGLIRETASWFGVQLRTETGFLTLARKNPEGKVSIGDMFMQDSATDEIPQEITKTANVEEVKSHLNRIGRLPTIEFKASSETGLGFDARPSFRDLVAFTFQPQHIVANPYTLFFKADTEEHRRRLANVLPYVLEAITVEQMQQRKRLQEIETQLKKLQDAYEVRQSTISTIFDDLQSQFVRARELGLLDSSLVPLSNWQVDDYVRALEAGLARVTTGETYLSAGGTANAVDELTASRELEDDLSRQLGRARSRLARIEQLQITSRGYKGELDEQRKRLAGLGWFENTIGSTHGCPLCGSTTDSASRELANLKQVASEAKQLSDRLEGAPVVLDKEAVQTRNAIGELETRLAKVRRRLRVLDDTSTRSAESRQRLPEVYRFAGQIEAMLANYRLADKGTELTKQIVDAKRERDNLGKGLNTQSQRKREEAAMQHITRSMSHYAEELNLERRGDVATINVPNLAVRVSGSGGREDFLWEIGSGENWVGYHLAALISLHEFFLSRPWSPVPSFLMIDQPSQVYFPERWPGDPKATGLANDRSLRTDDADIQGVRRIFKTLASAIARTGSRLQIIVTDHAGSITWDGLPVHVVEEWRAGKGNFLIPQSWYKAEA